MTTQHSLDLQTNTYNGWLIFDSIPEGWKIVKHVGSPLHGHVIIFNGISMFSEGHRKALAPRPPVEYPVIAPQLLPNLNVKNTYASTNNTENTKVVVDEHYRRTVNELARHQFKHKMLTDIMIDLTVCDLEGWDKKEYLHELSQLIASFVDKFPCLPIEATKDK